MLSYALHNVLFEYVIVLKTILLIAIQIWDAITLLQTEIYSRKKAVTKVRITAAKQGYRKKEHFFKREYKKEISSILTLSP